jgi:hypothetical protein
VEFPRDEALLNNLVKDSEAGALAGCNAGDRLASNDTSQPDLGKDAGRAFLWLIYQGVRVRRQQSLRRFFN